MNMKIFKEDSTVFVECEEFTLIATGNTLAEAFNAYLRQLLDNIRHYENISNTMLNEEGKTMKKRYADFFEEFRCYLY